MKKRYLSYLLSIALLFSNLGVPAFATEAGSSFIEESILTVENDEELSLEDNEEETKENDNKNIEDLTKEESLEVNTDDKEIDEKEKEALKDNTEKEADESSEDTSDNPMEGSDEDTENGVHDKSEETLGDGEEHESEDSLGNEEHDKSGESLENGLQDEVEESLGSAEEKPEEVISADILSIQGELSDFISPLSEDFVLEDEILNTENNEFTFITIDGKKVDSTAQGKPKLLFFFNSGCGNCINTMQSLAADLPEGVDVVAVDVEKNKNDTVTKFKNNYGNDHITFCYDTTDKAANSMGQYIYAIGKYQAVYPVLCYIDANNMLQYVSTGLSNADQIDRIFKATCTFEEKSYSIEYRLEEGEINHASNPQEYKNSMGTITLKDASKTGYVFKGWFLEEDFQTQVKEITGVTEESLVLYPKFIKELEITLPDKTTYFVGEKVDLTGAVVTHGASGQFAKLTTSMVKGFDSTKAGVCILEVTYKNCKTSFPVLILSSLEEQRGNQGETLSQVTIEENAYGSFHWKEGETRLEEVGQQTCMASFKPSEEYENIFSRRENISVSVGVYGKISEQTHEIHLEEDTFLYNGYEYRPKAEVFEKNGERKLSEENFTLSYRDNINASDKAALIVTGKGYYEGSIETNFVIEKRPLHIIAKDAAITIGEDWTGSLQYEVEGLVKQDSLEQEPTLEVQAGNSDTAGIYEIIPKGAVAGSNYEEEITYLSGKLKISEEKVGYQVTFYTDQNEDGPEVHQTYYGIKNGSLITKPENPEKQGYVFLGWYREEACLTEWNFATEIVQKDISLYAKWGVQNENNDFTISKILPQTYTGKAITPAVQVYDKGVLLKVNQDYKITYKNNINSSTEVVTEEFKEELPYVVIEGKGNYQGSIKINFVIQPAKIEAEYGYEAAGVKLSYTDQLTTNPKSAQSVFKSISMSKAMKEVQDFEVSLEAIEAFDKDSNPLYGTMDFGKVPAGSYGRFELRIEGKGNYTGTIQKEIIVASKESLIKNATITLGSKLKSIPLSTYQKEYGNTLEPAFYDAKTKSYYEVKNGFVDIAPEKIVDKNKVYTVKCGKTELVYGKDFKASVKNDKGVGTATLIIYGMGAYKGSKTVTFKLTGAAFNAKNIQISGLEDRTFTGAAITQNDVLVSYVNQRKESIPLEYGKDYSISYSKNINVGTASITFTALSSSGYQGSIKKTFKILAHPMEKVLLAEGTENIVLPFEKAGVKPTKEIVLKNEQGDILVSGKDYTISYKDNKAVVEKDSVKPPMVIVKGKGNYKGELKIPFSIRKAFLDSKNISITVSEMAFQANKADTYTYKPTVTLKDGTSSLSAKTDYTVQFLNNTQKDYREYYLQGQSPEKEKMPRVVIKPNPSGNYTLEAAEQTEGIIIPIPVYQAKFTAKNLHVVIAEASYTGTKLIPKVEVYYAPNNNAGKLKGMTEEEEIAKIDPQIRKLSEEEYKLTFGDNLPSGTNKGSVTVSGMNPLFGGSVTFKFNVIQRVLDIGKDMSGSSETEGDLGDSDGEEGKDPTNPGNGSDPTEPEGGKDPTDPGSGSDPTEPEDGGEDGTDKPTDPGDGEGKDLQETVKIDPITTTQKKYYSDSLTIEGYDQLKTVLKNQMVPQSVKEIMEDFPRTFSYLDKFNIGIGLWLYNGEDNVLAAVEANNRWDTNVSPVRYEMIYTLKVNMNSIAFEDYTAGTMTESGRTKLESVIAHEMMHAMMFEALSAGMMGRDIYGGYGSRFPTWFTEGIAQAVGGGADTIRNSLRIDENTTKEEITEIFNAYKVGEDNFKSNYGTSYMAVMYLGSLVDGNNSIQASDIANGLDIFLSELLKGKSMETVMVEKISKSLDDFTDSFAVNGAEFTKRLITEIGDGIGALAAESYQTMDVLDNQAMSENVFYLSIEYSEIKNTYPENYIVMAGGLKNNAGMAGPGYFSTGSN